MDQVLVPLTLVERIRPGFGDPESGEPYKIRRAFFDFEVGGISLYDAAAKNTAR
jgi:hypothetical protein